METGGHRRDPARDPAFAERRLGIADSGLECGQQIRSGADGGIEDADVVVREAEVLVESRAEQLGDEARLGLDHLRGREIDAALLPQVRVVGGEEILVEVQPQVAITSAPRQDIWFDCLDHALQEVHGHGHFFARCRVCEHAQDLREQAVPSVESFSGFGVQIRLALDPREQQRVGHRLRVGVGELRIVRVREEVFPPLLRKLLESGALGGGVLATDDLRRDYEELKAKGVEFVSPPKEEAYGFAALIKDDSGNFYSLTEER